MHNFVYDLQFTGAELFNHILPNLDLAFVKQHRFTSSVDNK